MPEQKAHLLLVEDETPLRLALADLLADAGYHVVQAHAGEEAVAALSQFAFDIVLTDLRLPGLAGTGVLDAALDRYPDILVVVMTGYGTVRDAVALIKRGAVDLIGTRTRICAHSSKPVTASKGSSARVVSFVSCSTSSRRWPRRRARFW
jgi:DNA-binding NtrC family response regulator